GSATAPPRPPARRCAPAARARSTRRPSSSTGPTASDPGRTVHSPSDRSRGAPRRPPRGEPVANPPIDDRLDAGPGTHDPPQLARREAAHHRYRPIMPCNRMKAHRKGQEPEARRGDPTPAQVAHHYGAARYTTQLFHEKRRVGIDEMVQQLGADDDVHGAVGKGKGERVGTHASVDRRPRRREQRARFVRYDGEQLETELARHRSGAPWNVSEPGADVEQDQPRLPVARRTPKRVAQRSAHRVQSAEPAIRARDVDDRPLTHHRIDVRIIEELNAAPAVRHERLRPATHRSNRAYPPR